MTAPESYAPRPVASHGVREWDGWRLKTYSIVAGADAADWATYDEAWPLAWAALPQPAVAAGRPGLGFVIAHSNVPRDLHYFVVCWWDRGNELPIRVFVRVDGAPWRAARGGESVCVWDLEVIWSEREAFVETMMGDGPPDADGYLQRAEVS